MRLPTESFSAPSFGPSVFDTARRCPAKASTSLMGRRPGTTDNPTGAAAGIVPARLDGGAWMAVNILLRSLAHVGPTSAWSHSTHAGQDLAALAARTTVDLDRAVRDFAVATVENLLDAQAATGTAMDFAPGFMSRDFRGGTLHAGGVFLFSAAEGAQAWRVTFGGDRPDEDRQAWALTAAYAVAGQLSTTHSGRTPIGVFEMSAVSGEVTELGAWTLDEVDAAFAHLERPRLQEMAHDLTVVSGSHCAGCHFVAACPAVRHATGLLPGLPRQPRVTPVTASDLTAYGSCPARYELLKIQGLPRVGTGGSEAMVRGRIFDEWLTAAHTSPGDPAACSADEVAAVPTGLTDDVRRLAEQHLRVCPLAEPGVTDLETQPTRVLLDVDSQVLLVARPDAAYLLDGSVVWRETKTRASVRARDPYELVQGDLAAAIYLTVLHGTAGPAAMLEWEELDVHVAEVTVLPCDDDDLVDFARNTAAGAIADMLRDDTRAPRPGVWCEHCAAAHWCPAAPEA